MTSQALQDAVKAHTDFLAAHPEQFRLSLPLWRLLAEGKPIEPEQLATVSHRSLKEIQALLQSSDMRVDQEGNILAFGLSLQPTPHQFHLGEQALYTWCALDALAFPPLLGRAARVISTCPATGTEIRLTVTPERIERLEPTSAVVSVRLPREETDLCNDGYFFVSHEVASTWPSLHPQAVLLSVEEAGELGRELARQFLALEQEPEVHYPSSSGTSRDR